MIYRQTAYACKCDNCSQTFDNSHFNWSASIDVFSMEQLIEEDGWHLEGAKHYCPECYSFDEEDNLVLKIID